MNYKASIKSYDPDDEENADFDSEDEAANWLSSRQPYHRNRGNMQLNGRCVRFQDGKLVDFSTPLDAKSQASFDRLFRPHSVRPTNVATLAATGKLESGQ